MKDDKRSDGHKGDVKRKTEQRKEPFGDLSRTNLTREEISELAEGIEEQRDA